MSAPKETYLGDGLYASFDGWMITLRAPRMTGDHWVALEPEVYAALLRFVEEREEIRQRKEPTKRARRPVANDDDSLIAALQAVLLFHGASQWTPDVRSDWKELTGCDEATTRVLCDTVRAALIKAGVS